mmetsp:Transcript_105211/g.183004  ORF Transcript_105211/g.183004 Transcript_105211/m.183004 type:complete len:1936 (+) Transcript_105211:74-5881(+)
MGKLENLNLTSYHEGSRQWSPQAPLMVAMEITRQDTVSSTGGGAPIQWKAIGGAEGEISAQSVFPAKQSIFSSLCLEEMGLSLVPYPSRCGRGVDAAACVCLEAVRIGPSARQPRDSSVACGSVTCGLCRSDVTEFCIRCCREADSITDGSGPAIQPDSFNDGCDRTKCDIAVSASCSCGPFHAHCLEHWFAQTKALLCPACMKPWREATGPEDAKPDLIDVFLTGKVVKAHSEKVCVDLRKLSDQTPRGLKAFVANVIGAAPAELDSLILRQLGNGLLLDMDTPLQLRGNDKFALCSMLAACSKYMLRVEVQLPAQKRIQLDLDSQDTVAKVCQEVQRREGFMAARLNLYGQRHQWSGTSTIGSVKLARSVRLCEVVSHQMMGEDPEKKPLFQNVVLRGELLESEPKLVDIDFFGSHGRRLPSTDPDACVHQIWPSIDPLRGDFLYVSIRSTFGQSDEERQEKEAPAGRVGAQQLFTVTEAWSPWQQAQSDEGMRRLLAILHVVASHCKGDDASKLACTMRRLVPEFPPAADALRVVLGKRTGQVSRAEQAAVATGIFAAIKKLIGSSIPDDPRRLFEVGVRPVFYWLLCEGLRESAPGSFQWVQMPISQIPEADEVCAAYGLEKAFELLVRKASPKSSDLPAPSRIPWNQLLKLLKTGEGFKGEHTRWSGLLRVLSPLALGRAPRPSLTRDENGHMCVFTGMGKDVSRNTQIFLPLRGEEICTDVHHVAQKLRQLGDLGDKEAAAEDSRTPQEAIMVLLDTSNSMNASSGFQRTSGDRELDRLDQVRQEGWDDTIPDDDSPEKRQKIIEAFRNHPNLPDLRKMCQNRTFFSNNSFAVACFMERLAVGVLQELCRLERVKPDADPDVCRIYTKNKEVFVKILLDNPAASRVDLSGKWCIEIQQANATEVQKKAKKPKKNSAKVRFTLPVGKYELCLQQSDNRLTGEGKDWSVEGEIENQSATFRLTKNGLLIAECETEISSDGMELQAGSWRGAAIGSGSFVGSRVDVQPSSETEPPAEFLCPITQELMEDPVTCADGHSYESQALNHWARTLGHRTSPLTGASFPRLASSIVQNHALRKQIEAWRLKHPSAGSGSKSSASQLQRPPSFQIFVRTLTGKTIVLDVDDETLIIEVKKKIMEATGIPCEAQRGYTFAGKLWQDESKTLKECGVKKHDSLQLVMNHCGYSAVARSASASLPILVTIVDKRSNQKMSLVAKPGDTVEGIMLKCWCVNPDDMQPSQVTLWTAMEEAGDNYFTGKPVSKLSTKISKFQLQRVQGGSENSYFAGEVEMGMTKRYIPMHQRRELCRLECVKQLFHAFVNRSQAYDYPNEMGLAVFGDSVEVVSEISNVLEDFREKVDDVDCDGDTCLYDALDKAASKLEEWKRSKQQSLPPDASLRMLVLSDGQDTRSGCSAWEVARRLQRANITVDAITIGGERDKNLHAIAKATGGYVFNPKSLADALRLNELEVLLSSSERPPKAKSREVTSKWALSSYESFPVDKCDGDNVPARRRMPLLSLRASSLADAVHVEEEEGTTDAASKPAAKDEVATHSRETHSRTDVAGSAIVPLLAYLEAIRDKLLAARGSKLDIQKLQSLLTLVVKSIQHLSADSPADVKSNLEQMVKVLPPLLSDLDALNCAVLSMCEFLNVKLKELSSSTEYVVHLQKLISYRSRLKKQAASAAAFASLPAAGSLPTATAPGPHNASRQRRAMAELRHFLRAPHPSVEVFPSDDIFFWKMLLEGPEGTPYAGGLWVLYCLLPPNYPDCPPEIRFVTPIRHCNVNVYGRVCHSILDRNYTCDTTVLTIMHCIYGLLLNPDYDDPLDSTLALEFYEASGLYENSIMAHVSRHAGGRDREDLRRRLMEGDDICNDAALAARPPLEAPAEALPADLHNVWEQLRATFDLLPHSTQDSVSADNMNLNQADLSQPSVTMMMT